MGFSSREWTGASVKVRLVGLTFGVRVRSLRVHPNVFRQKKLRDLWPETSPNKHERRKPGEQENFPHLCWHETLQVCDILDWRRKEFVWLQKGNKRKWFSYCCRFTNLANTKSQRKIHDPLNIKDFYFCGFVMRRGRDGRFARNSARKAIKSRFHRLPLRVCF